MRTFTIPLVFPTSTGSSWSFPFVKAGMTCCACWNITLSAVLKPRSAKTRQQFIQDSAVLSSKFVRCWSSPSLGNVGDCALRRYPNQHFVSVMVFVWWLCCWKQIWWPINKYFKTSNVGTQSILYLSQLLAALPETNCFSHTRFFCKISSVRSSRLISEIQRDLLS